MALKWFPDKRGLASGIIVGAFGAGAALFIPEIAYIIRVHNYATAFLYTGIVQGLAIVLRRAVPAESGPGFLAALKIVDQTDHPAANRAVQFARNAAHSAILRSLLDDADDGHRRLDGHRASRSGGRAALRSVPLLSPSH